MTAMSVGVVMPVYNGELHVGAALRSLLRETGVALHIVVVDDGSTDGTRAIVQALAQEHPSVHLIESDHGGVSRARNVGLAALPPEVSLVTFLDSDDLNPAGRIGHQCELLDRHPDVDCVIGMVQVFEDEDKERLAPREGSRIVTVRGVQLGCGLFRRCLLERLGGMAEDMHYGEDTDLYLRILEAGTTLLKDDAIAVYYRRHPGNVTNDLARTRAGFIDAIRRSLERRRATGVAVELGDLFRARGEVERIFRNA